MAFRTANFAHLAKFNSAASSEFLDFYEDNVNQMLQAKAAERPHQTFAPSSCRCLRRSWFRIRGVDPDVPKKADASLQFTADIGTACHRIIQSNLREFLQSDWIDVETYIKHHSEFAKDPNNYTVTIDPETQETQIEIFRPYPIRFACDGIIRWKGEYYLLEIKTSEYSSWDNLTDPKDEHMAQVKCYATLLGIDKVLFLYQDRQHGPLKCYEYKVSYSDKQSVLKDLQTVMDHVEWNIPPKGLPAGDKWCTSSYCPYYIKCHQWGGR